MRYEHIWYTTKDQSLTIEFLMLHLGGTKGWRAYILTDINYKRVSTSRSTGWHDTHRFFESSTERYIDVAKSYPYVCWEPAIQELNVLKNVAAVWCEITAYYIRHGGTFPAIQQKLADQGVI